MVSAALLAFDFARASWAGGSSSPIRPTGRQVGIDRLDRPKPPAERLFFLVASMPPIRDRLRLGAEPGFALLRPGDVLVPGAFRGFRPR
jgi:hypothetical protein